MDDADVDDGVLNFVGENLFVVQEVTVCNKPSCSANDRGVRCRDVDLDAVGKEKRNHENSNYLIVIGMMHCESEWAYSNLTYREIAIRADFWALPWKHLPMMLNNVHRSYLVVHLDQDRQHRQWFLFVVTAVIQLIRPHFAHQSHSLCLATNAIGATFAVDVPNVPLNPFSMQMPTIQMVYRLNQHMMNAHVLVSFLRESHTWNLRFTKQMQNENNYISCFNYE